MVSFILCFIALVVGYAIYGRFVEKVFGPDPKRRTPAVANADGIDFVPLPAWRVCLIQFLNIAGTGPIFGAIMGAKFGPASYLWIVLGSIFAGAVHDYFSGMLSVRNGGANVPDIVGKYLGPVAKRVMLVVCVILLILVGTVFVDSPALIMDSLVEGNGGTLMIWVAVIFIYYVIATLLPIDKIIGRIYPFFAFAMLFMAVALMVCLIMRWPSIPELFHGPIHPGKAAGLNSQDIFPCLFITIACGAVSGFHATQSPLMARCIKNEKLGRPVFYGSMIAEGIVALIWAAVSSYFFFDGGAAECGSTISAQAPEVVTSVASEWLGPLGGVLAIIGVVICPLTSGDTAFRGARLIIADFLHLNQKKKFNRLAIAVPIFAATALLLWFNAENKDGFNKIWRYFGLCNQTLAAIMLWTITVFLSKKRRRFTYFLTLIPACFVTSVCVTNLFVDKITLGIDTRYSPYIGVASFLIPATLFFWGKLRRWPVLRRNQ